MENLENKVRDHNEIVSNIKTVIEANIKPAVASHGGEVKFIKFKEGTLNLMMSGACSGCAGSQATLKYGIENMMKHYVPEVLTIEGEDDTTSTVDPYYERWAGFNDAPEDM